MDKKKQQERQAFLDEIANYQYIRDDGRLVLEPFGVYLSHCFGFDGILEMSPYPNDVYLLLIKLIRAHFGDEEAQTKIQFQKIADWRPEMAYVYPDRRMTCIHISALVHVSHDWIYDIGHILMGLPEPSEPGKYFAWAKEEWLAVHTFINGYHNAFNVFLKKFDKSNISKNGYSSFEALHLAQVKNIDFDEAANQLKARHDSYQAAMEQIRKAIHDGYYLEAIALEECLISNCLFNFLDGTGSRLVNPSFHTLLREAAAKQAVAHESPSALLGVLDQWRKSRNLAIHGFIASHSRDLDQSRANFHDLSKATALQGEDFCKAVVSWYEGECVNFIAHEFPSTQGRTLQ